MFLPLAVGGEAGPIESPYYMITFYALAITLIRFAAFPRRGVGDVFLVAGTTFLCMFAVGRYLFGADYSPAMSAMFDERMLVGVVVCVGGLSLTFFSFIWRLLGRKRGSPEVAESEDEPARL